jgi:hypothetical protein
VKKSYRNCIKNIQNLLTLEVALYVSIHGENALLFTTIVSCLKKEQYQLYVKPIIERFTAYHKFLKLLLKQ